MNRKIIQGLTLLSGLLLIVFSCNKGDSTKENSRQGFQKQIVETGQLNAINSIAFPLERYGRYWYEMRIIGLLEHGSLIEKGDSIIQLDPAEIRKSIIEWESNLETQMANLEKLKVDQNIRRNEMISNIKNQQASFEMKKLEIEASRFESERQRKIKELEFKQEQIQLEKEEKKMNLYEIIAASDLKVQEIRVLQLKNQIKNAYSILPRLTIRTPVSGVFQVGENWRTNEMIKIGDNVYTGNNMANVPELKYMKVTTSINETDFLDIYEGQKVIVRMDAVPDLAFDGEVSYIGKLCHEKEPGSRQKVFDVEIKILQSDERLKPGMTVSCEYLQNE
ncbi:MAG: efflux RND transporter periplasmic adaptor subunit [Dysgonamonadaceae bacterium]|jgi:hypothetical protein|nr:efflux RND transporter periplasmic adaptor subunit [Dysgonamonadaceae bacterium]